MPDQTPSHGEPELPSRLGGLDPGELFARGMHSIKISTAEGLGWTPLDVALVAPLFPNYEVNSMLGHGGMGAVYRARHIPLDRLVAIKLLPLEISVDQNFAERFRREARAMAKLAHPNILSVFDFGETIEGHLFIVMEYVDGGTVHDLVHGTDAGLAPSDALAIVEYVCDALAYAHEHGIVHRDMKPANVLIDRQGHVKVADFGLARLTDTVNPGAPGRTLTGVVMGTPDYMSPEQKKGAHVDHRADIYAIGVMLYEMLCKETPQGAFEPASKRCGIDKRIDAIVTRALAQQPEKRFQSTIEIKTAVASVRPSVVRTQKKHGTTAMVVPVGADTASESKVPARWIFPAVVLVLVGALVAWLAMTGAFHDLHLRHPAPSGFSASSEAWRDALSDPAFQAPPEGLERSNGGLLFKTKGNVVFAAGPKRDGAVRFLAWFAEDLEDLKITARETAGQGRYQGFLTADGKGADCQLFNGASTGIDGIKYTALTSPLLAGDVCEVEMRLIGKSITLKVNGQVVAEGEDAGRESGDFGMLWRGQRPLSVKAVQYLNLDASGSAKVAPAAAAKLSASSEPWQNALSDPGFEDAGTGVERTAAGLVIRKKGLITFAAGPKRDGALRLLAPFSPELESLKAIARAGAGRYQGFVLEDGSGGDCQLFNGASTGIDSIRLAPLAQPLKPGEPCELELRVVGKLITVKINGRLVAQGEDATYGAGKFGLLWQKDSPVAVKALEYLDLSGR